jgi:hypothetical protein
MEFIMIIGFILIFLLALCLSLSLYFIPTIIAKFRNNENAQQIFRFQIFSFLANFAITGIMGLLFLIPVAPIIFIIWTLSSVYGIAYFIFWVYLIYCAATDSNVIFWK